MYLSKKAFTMIELLATITILGIAMVVSISAVSSLIEKSKNEYYNSQEKNVTLAAQSYAQSNRDYLPKGIGQKNRIKLSTLLKSNYLKEVVKDYNKKNCDMEKSYIDIFKYSQKDYSYVVYLQCPNYNSTEQINKITPEINISISGNSMKDAKAVIKIKGNEKLMGYSYTIFYRKNSTDSWEEKINSGSLNGNQSTSREVTFSLAEYVPGNIKIQVSATNIYGMNTSKTATHKFEDNDGPECVYINEEDKYVKGSSTHRAWITDKTQSRKITVGCNDGNGVGCARASYTKTFTDDAISGEIKIKDKSGNSTTCQVSVYIDKTAPTIKLKTYKRSSSGKTGSVLKEVQANELKKSASINSCFDNNKNYKTTNGNDCWLNKEQYPNGIYYELDYQDTISLAKSEWTYANSTKTTTLSGKTAQENKAITEEGYGVAKIKLQDEAGNISEVNITANIDRTAPNKPGITNNNYNSNGWSNKNFSLVLNSSDTLAGIANYEYSYNQSDWTKYANSSTETFKTTDFSIEREQNVYMRVMDRAGNYSSVSSTPIRLDKTAPTVKVELYARKTDGTPTGKALKTFENNEVKLSSSDGNNGWMNAKDFPGGVYYKETYTDERSGLIRREWKYNNTGLTESSSDLNILVGQDAPVTLNGKTVNDTTKIGTEGYRKAELQIYDKAGNVRTIKFEAKLDRTAPSCSIQKTNIGTTSGVTANISCAGGDKYSKITTCPNSESGIKASKSYTVKDEAGNSNTCSVTVASSTQCKYNSYYADCSNRHLYGTNPFPECRNLLGRDCTCCGTGYDCSNVGSVDYECNIRVCSAPYCHQWETVYN